MIVRMDLPEDKDMLEAAGRVAIANGQLEYILQMTVKSLAGLITDRALDATSMMNMYQLREWIKKLFKQESSNEEYKTKIDALLK